MSKQSAGIVVYRHRPKGLEVLLGHMGGPFFAHKDKGAWSIPKGEFTDEEPFVAAKREFQEETGQPAPDADYRDLGTVHNKSGKTIYAWATEYDYDTFLLTSNIFVIEWPPKSGQQQTFPELDRFGWFSFSDALAKITAGQVALLHKLAAELGIAQDDQSSAQVSLL